MRIARRKQKTPGVACEPEPVQARGQRIGWARLLERVFDIDLPRCPSCGAGGLEIIAAILERAASVRNIAAGAPVCVSFIDVFVQKGFKVFGAVRNVRRQDADFPRWSAPLEAMAGPRFPVHSVIVVRATAVEPILAPSYRLHPADTTEASQVAAAIRTYGVRPGPVKGAEPG